MVCIKLKVTAIISIFSIVFLLFEEPTSGITISPNAVEHGSDPATRKNWDAMEFAKSHNLKLVGVNYLETKAQE